MVEFYFNNQNDAFSINERPVYIILNQTMVLHRWLIFFSESHLLFHFTSISENLVDICLLQEEYVLYFN
jgi:hypothetical protein